MMIALRFVAATLLAGFLLAGCGEGDDGSMPSSQPSEVSSKADRQRLIKFQDQLAVRCFPSAAVVNAQAKVAVAMSEMTSGQTDADYLEVADDLEAMGPGACDEIRLTLARSGY